MNNSTSQESTVIGSHPFAKCNEIASELHLHLSSFANFSRLTILHGGSVQAVQAVRHCKVRYEAPRWEIHTLRITQLSADQPAVVTGTRQYTDESGTTFYERVPAWTLLSDTNFKAADLQITAFIEYFKSLPRTSAWGSVEDVAFFYAADAEACLVDLIHEHFNEV